MRKKRILILGAGLSGLSAAWHLQRRGIECLIFEKEPEAGGLCRSKKINGFTFDCDGHLLHFKHRYTFAFIKKLLQDNLAGHKRSAWVYSHGCYSRYPFQAKLHGLPSPVIKECLLGFFDACKDQRLKNKKIPTFLDWINHTFGKGIARHFMIPYNTKFWTLPPQKLTCGWLDGFIPVPSLNQVIEGTIEDNQRQFGYNANFWYPKRGGIISLPLSLLRQIKNIYTGCQVTEVNREKKEIKMASGAKEKFDYLISTIPLPEMAYILKGAPKEVLSLFVKLRWNSIFNLNLGIDKKDSGGRHWVYFPQEDICFFRIGFSHNFSGSVTPKQRGSLYVELAYSKDKPINKDRITRQIKADLNKTGILSSSDKIYAQDINDIKYGYPVYDVNYNKAREGIVNYLSRQDIMPCGRYGSWRYLSMEGAILDGKRAADIL